MEKSYLREKIKKERKRLLKEGTIDDLSKKISNNILWSSLFQSAKNIALYYPLKGEIDITSITKIKDKNFYLPRVCDRELEFVPYGEDTTLIPSCFGVLEPMGAAIDPYILDIIFTPALCANSSCFRLGYGMGYYDRFFSKHNLHAKKIIIVSSNFITDEFMEDEHDYCLDEILCEKNNLP